VMEGPGPTVGHDVETGEVAAGGTAVTIIGHIPNLSAAPNTLVRTL
jgi:hypothetical protein